MANYNNIIQFIKIHEGGWVNNPLDKGGETNKGITYNTWCNTFGNNTHSRFIAMSDDDWNTIWKHVYWDAINGDSINSQRIADTLVDWVWGSGAYYPVKAIQMILKQLGFTLEVDGVIGHNTLVSINTVDEPALFKLLVKERFKFLAQIPINNPSQKIFIDGWLNRMVDLIFTEVRL